MVTKTEFIENNLEEVIKKHNELKSLTKTSEYFNISRVLLKQIFVKNNFNCELPPTKVGGSSQLQVKN